MAKRTYRSAQGKQVDFNALLSQNETVPALGNMGVNARGDQITSDGVIVKTGDQIMSEYHKMNTMVPKDERIPEDLNDILEEDTQEPLVKTEAAQEDEEDQNESS